ncbi:MAG: hypothetical protein P4L81_03195 [Candidatus Pacebacteria bacterium]|nr:hypothetical protein [Candidatus Paceibacterota bacterium]
MRIVILCAALLCAGLTSFVSSARAGEAGYTSECCERTVTSKRVVGYEERLVRVPVYRHFRHRVKVPCCAPQKPVEVTPPPPETVTVRKDIYVVEQPVIHRIPAPPIVVRPSLPVCCPTGQNIPNVQPCPSASTGYYGGGVHVAVAGPGYVPGAPRNPEECTARGGSLVPSKEFPGRSACAGYR